MMFFRACSPSQHLAQSPVVLSVKRQSRYRLLAFFCLLVLLALSLDRFCSQCRQWPWWPNPSPTTAYTSHAANEQALQQERDNLQKEIDRLLLEQRIAGAVRQKLELQITSLQEQIKAAQLQLEFFKSNQAKN